MTRSRLRRASRLLASVGLVALAAVSAAGCTTTSFGDITSIGGSQGLLSSRKPDTTETGRGDTDGRGDVEAYAERYRADPRDPEAAIRYAQALRRSGQRAQATAVLQQASIRNPANKKVLGAYGRALADVGSFAQALDVLSRAHAPEQPDWRILSAQGAVLDQMGRFEEARRYYKTALKIVPDEPSVLSNLGLSYALSKELRQAETSLRHASIRGSADRRIRQNLALVVGLQGRFKEAQEIARADLPAEEAAANVAYLKQMLARRDKPKPDANVATQDPASDDDAS